MHWQQVFGSSNVSAIAYDADKQECLVRFHNNSVYAYEGVGPGIWNEFLHSESKGRYVQVQLRRAHKARREADYVEDNTGRDKPESVPGDDPESVPAGNKNRNLGYSN
jgi:hypothetical protein